MFLVKGGQGARADEWKQRAARCISFASKCQSRRTSCLIRSSGAARICILLEKLLREEIPRARKRVWWSRRTDMMTLDAAAGNRPVLLPAASSLNQTGPTWVKELHLLCPLFLKCSLKRAPNSSSYHRFFTQFESQWSLALVKRFHAVVPAAQAYTLPVLVLDFVPKVGGSWRCKRHKHLSGPNLKL